MEEGLVGRISIALRECGTEEGLLCTRDGREDVCKRDLGGVGFVKQYESAQGVQV
jgi:hypothetical protein